MESIKKLQHILDTVGKDPYQGMDANERKLTKLRTLLQSVEESVTKKDLELFVKSFMKAVVEIERKITAKANAQSVDVDNNLRSMRGEIERLKKSLDSMLQSSISDTERILDKKHTQLLRDVEKRLSVVQDLQREVARLDDIESKIPELPAEKVGEDYRNALEALPEGDKLSINAIENLREELDKMKKASTGTVISGGITGRDMVKNYDLSSQLDGVTKTFNIPAVWSIVTVACSSFPNILRPTIDYTNTTTTITFTDEIDAGSTLATGQTVILTIVSA